MVKADDSRMRIDLTIAKTINFTEKPFFYIMLGFTSFNSSPLQTTPKVVSQKVPGICKNEKPINSMGTDENH